MDLDELEWLDREVVLDTSESKRAYVVRTRSGKYLRLTASAFRLIRHLKEGRSLEDLAHAMHQDPQEARAAYVRLCEKLEAASERDGLVRAGFWLKVDLLPAAWVARASSLFAWTFRPWAALPLLVFAALVATAWGVAPTRARIDTSGLHLSCAYGLFFLSLAVHELGHAAACKRFGASPSAIGFAFYLFFPVLYSDVSEAWALPRRQRVVVGLGGAYLQSITGAIYVALYMATGWSPSILAVAGIAGTLTLSLNPFFRFDGYWVIADLLGVSNLSREGGRALRHGWDRLRGHTPAPLPWRGWLVWAMGAHAALSLAAIGWMLVRMGPPLLAHLLDAPRVALRFVQSFRGPSEVLTGADMTGLAGAAISVLFACIMLWRLLSSLTGRIRKSIGRLRALRARAPNLAAERDL